MERDSFEAVIRLEQRMNVVEEGVANFRDFQAEARQFFTEYKTTEKMKQLEAESIKQALVVSDRRTTTMLTLIAIALTLIFGILGAWIGYRTMHEKDAQTYPTSVQSPQNAGPRGPN